MLPYSLLGTPTQPLAARTRRAGGLRAWRCGQDHRSHRSRLPPAAGAAAWAEITRPTIRRSRWNCRRRGRRVRGLFTMSESGVHRTASEPAATPAPAIRGSASRRDAAVWRGGDHDADPANSGGGPVRALARRGARAWCQLLLCMTGERTRRPRSSGVCAKTGIDLDGLRNCLKPYCRSDDARMAEPRR